ncbi:class I SAM-dependent methyltransferase [Treponema socranskii]|uniref:class I SAM-dependent methyltransferase n=1 Tax=Treponema socranskii TaxID=53419 RepID=UPI0036186841
MALSKLGYDVIGIDYSSKMIEAAKKMASYIRYYVQDTRELSFDSGLFDYALFSFNGLMLLETYADRKKATLEISMVLKYNGLLFFTTPFLDNKIEKKYWAEKTRAFNTEFLNLCQYVNKLVRDNRKVKVIPGNAGLTGHKLCVNGMA